MADENVYKTGKSSIEIEKKKTKRDQCSKKRNNFFFNMIEHSPYFN